MDYGFVAYIDESGDDGLSKVHPIDPSGSSEWFVLSAVVVQASNENAVGRLQRDILDKFRHSQRRDIHYRDLISAKKTIACQEIGAAKLRCFVAMSNKKNMRGYSNPRCAQEKNYMYWWMTRLLMEKVTEFCARKSIQIYGEMRPVKMMFSLRGGMSYSRLIDYFRLLHMQTGTAMLYLTAGILRWEVVDLKQIYAIAHKNEAGLQLADVVAGAFFEAVSMEGSKLPCADYAELLLPRIYRGPGGQYIGYGIKPMPRLPRMNLRTPQRRIFELAGFSANRW